MERQNSQKSDIFGSMEDLFKQIDEIEKSQSQASTPVEERSSVSWPSPRSSPGGPALTSPGSEPDSPRSPSSSSPRSGSPPRGGGQQFVKSNWRRPATSRIPESVRSAVQPTTSRFRPDDSWIRQPSVTQRPLTQRNVGRLGFDRFEPFLGQEPGEPTPTRRPTAQIRGDRSWIRHPSVTQRPGTARSVGRLGPEWYAPFQQSGTPRMGPTTQRHPGVLGFDRYKPFLGQEPGEPAPTRRPTAQLRHDRSWIRQPSVTQRPGSPRQVGRLGPERYSAFQQSGTQQMGPTQRPTTQFRADTSWILQPSVTQRPGTARSVSRLGPERYAAFQKSGTPQMGPTTQRHPGVLGFDRYEHFLGPKPAEPTPTRRPTAQLRGDRSWIQQPSVTERPKTARSVGRLGLERYAAFQQSGTPQMGSQQRPMAQLRGDRSWIRQPSVTQGTGSPRQVGRLGPERYSAFQQSGTQQISPTRRPTAQFRADTSWIQQPSVTQRPGSPRQVGRLGPERYSAFQQSGTQQMGPTQRPTANIRPDASWMRQQSGQQTAGSTQRPVGRLGPEWWRGYQGSQPSDEDE